MMNERASAPTVSLDALFIAFLEVALCGLGSGVVLARRIAVERRGWVSEEEFSDILGLCQFMPGPNVVGIAVCVGAKVRGLAGTIAAASGFVLIPLIFGFLLGMLFLGHVHLAVLQNVLGGISAVAAGLFIATGVRMLTPYCHRPQSLIIAAAAFGGMAFTRLPLLVVLFGAALLSIVIAEIDEVRLS